ncbi:MAG: radical SAM protein [bacterium]|nr:radical SAM protein [bacterium]
MNICLVNPPINPHNAPVELPLQLIILDQVSRDAGWQSYIIDFNLLTKCNPRFPLSDRFFTRAVDYLQEYAPDLIAISCLSSSLSLALELTRHYKKKDPRCRILLGGPQVTLLHDKILEASPFIDMACRGEGEHTLRQILLSGNDFESVSGLTFRANNGNIVVNADRDLMDDMDEIPIPDYKSIDLEAYKRVMPSLSIPIEAGRGCPHGCAYCATSVVWRKKFRLKTTVRLIKEVEQSCSQTGIQRIRFVHDLFSLDRSWVEQLCRHINASPISIEWGCDTRTDAVDRKLLEAMSRCGCQRIFFGIESGSISMQKKLKKHLDPAHAVEMVKTSLGCGIETTTSFLLGHPGETPEELAETLNKIFLLKMMNVSGMVINFFTPEVGTLSHEACADNLTPNFHSIRKDLPIKEKNTVQMIEKDPMLFSHFHKSGTSCYDMSLVPKIIDLIPVISHLPSLMNVFLNGSKSVLVAFEELHKRVKPAMWVDGYGKVVFDPEKLYNGIKTFIIDYPSSKKAEQDGVLIEKEVVRRLSDRLNQQP